MQSLAVDLHHLAHHQKADQAKTAGDELRQNRRPGGARDAHAQTCDKPDVQHRVQRTGDQQKDQRRDRIAQTAQNAGENVVIGGS